MTSDRMSLAPRLVPGLGRTSDRPLSVGRERGTRIWLARRAVGNSMIAVDSLSAASYPPRSWKFAVAPRPLVG